MKKNGNFAELMQYAGRHRILTYLSWILSAVSALLALVPFVYIWLIIREVLEVMARFLSGDKSGDLRMVRRRLCVWFHGDLLRRADVFASFGVPGGEQSENQSAATYFQAAGGRGGRNGLR